MKTQNSRARTRSVLLSSVLLALALAFGGRAEAQAGTGDCRCIDQSGRPLENCICVRTPGQQGMVTLLQGEAPRARIGVALEEDARGARITEVMAGSPAAAAGLAAGDVIARVDGRSLLEPLADARRERLASLSDAVAVQRMMGLALDWDPGQAVELEVLRGGAPRTVRLEPEAAPPSEAIRVFGGGREVMPGGNFQFRFDSLPGFDFRVDSLTRMPLVLRADSLSRIATAFRAGSLCGGPAVWGGAASGWVSGGDCVDGVRLVALGAELGEYFGATRGVLVTAVDDASSLGLRGGDVIVSIGGRAVESPDQAVRILASYRAGEPVPLQVIRRGQQLQISGTRR